MCRLTGHSCSHPLGRARFTVSLSLCVLARFTPPLDYPVLRGRLDRPEPPFGYQLSGLERGPYFPLGSRAAPPDPERSRLQVESEAQLRMLPLERAHGPVRLAAGSTAPPRGANPCRDSGASVAAGLGWQAGELPGSAMGAQRRAGEAGLPARPLAACQGQAVPARGQRLVGSSRYFQSRGSVDGGGGWSSAL